MLFGHAKTPRRALLGEGFCVVGSRPVGRNRERSHFRGNRGRFSLLTDKGADYFGKGANNVVHIFFGSQ